jgi:hypothetical protein
MRVRTLPIRAANVFDNVMGFARADGCVVAWIAHVGQLPAMFLICDMQLPLAQAGLQRFCGPLHPRCQVRRGLGFFRRGLGFLEGVWCYRAPSLCHAVDALGFTAAILNVLCGNYSAL